MSQLLDDYLKESIRASRVRRFPHGKTQQSEKAFAKSMSRSIRESRTASQKALYVSKTATVSQRKVSVTDLEKTPLAAQLVLERQMVSNEHPFPAPAGAKCDAESKCPSKGPSKRNGDPKRLAKEQEKYDSRNQMIMVAGPTGKRNYELGERHSFSPTESISKIGSQIALKNLTRGLKDPSKNPNPFLVKNNEGVTPSLFHIDSISQALSGAALEAGNDSHGDGRQLDKRFSSPMQSKIDLSRRFDLVYQNDCDSRKASEKPTLKFDWAGGTTAAAKHETATSAAKGGQSGLLKKPPMRAFTMGQKTSKEFESIRNTLFNEEEFSEYSIETGQKDVKSKVKFE